MQPRTLLLSPKAWLPLALEALCCSQSEQRTPSKTPRPPAGIETLKHLPLSTLPARRVSVEHARRASLSQTAVLAPSTALEGINASP
jgi:hypothetical protein